MSHYVSNRQNLVQVPVTAQRHTQPVGCNLVFGSMNVRSLSKLDLLLNDFCDRSLDVMLLCETWHDSDSVPIRRFHADGFGVVERARPRPRRAEVSLTVNHGGVAIVAAAGTRLTAVDVDQQPTTFEFIAARVSSGPSSCIAVVIYHPGSSPVTYTFFTELAELVDRLSTYVDPIVLAGDANIRLERATDPHTAGFCDLFCSIATHP